MMNSKSTFLFLCKENKIMIPRSNAVKFKEITNKLMTLQF